MKDGGTYDVAIIGAGIIGIAAAYELSGYELDIAVVEEQDDVAKGSTRANSAVIHAGYDPPAGSLMAKTNVRGSVLWKRLAEQLGIEYKAIGSLVVAKGRAEREVIERLYDRGAANGVKELKLLSREQALGLEPNLNKQDLSGALYAGTAAIINPWQACVAMAESASRNGADFFFERRVTSIKSENGTYHITAGGKLVKSKYVINAAGTGAGEIHKLAGGGSFGSYTVKGEYYVLDRVNGKHVGRIIFPAPSSAGKGILVTPTVHGNLLIGPTAAAGGGREDTATTREGLGKVREQAARIVDGIAFGDNIRNFAGLRAYIDSEDFLVAESPILKGFINLAGIKSPGLSSAPAIAELAAGMLRDSGLALKKKKNITGYRLPERFADMDREEQARRIKEDPLFGRVVCRCETVTEGEIVNALKSGLCPPTIAAVKRRVNTGMGRCQGGFCSVRIHEIIARERSLCWEQVTLDGGGSYIVTDDTKGGDAW